MRRRTFLTTSTGFVIATTLSAPRLARAKTDSIRLVQSNYGFLFVPAMAAAEMGHFKKNGLEAEFIVNLGGSEALAATLSGDADINVGAANSALRSRQRGTDAKIFGTSAARYASNLVISTDMARKKGVDRSSPLDARIEALRGSRIAVIGLGSGTHQLMLYLAKRGKLNPDSDLEIMGIGQTSAVLTAFQQGRIDGFIASSPSGEQAVANYEGTMLINTAGGDIPELNDYPYVTYISTDSWLEKNRDVVTRFQSSIDAALLELHDPATSNKVRDLLYNRYHDKTERGIFDSAWATTLAAWPKTSGVTRPMAQRALDFLNQFSDQPYPADLLDTGFVY